MYQREQRSFLASLAASDVTLLHAFLKQGIRCGISCDVFDIRIHGERFGTQFPVTFSGTFEYRPFSWLSVEGYTLNDIFPLEIDYEQGADYYHLAFQDLVHQEGFRVQFGAEGTPHVTVDRGVQQLSLIHI